jgi:hypothetical protein
MIEPAMLDVVELVQPLPDEQLPLGAQGTVLEAYGDGRFEVEFINDAGETIALTPLTTEQFIVVWQADRQEWVSLGEQVAQIVNRLPAPADAEVLDFARFLSLRQTGAAYRQAALSV